MFPIFRFMPLFVGGTFLIAGGVVHGLWTDRWGASAAMRAAADRLPSVPLVVGDWEGKPSELDAEQLRVADVAGHVCRRYVQRGTGNEVNVILLCGRPGPLAVHRPEVCYTGAGFEMDGEREKWTAPRNGEFWTARFRKLGPDLHMVRIFWAWGTAGDWKAEENPRFRHAPSTPLYKLYVVRGLARPDEPLDQEPAVRFLQVFLPELQKCLGASPDRPLSDHVLAQKSRIR